MSFQELGLVEPVLRAVSGEGYTTPTPIQQQAIPHILAGRDLLGCAQTGTGKTAAFALPILHQLIEAGSRPEGHRHKSHGRSSRVLVLSPTRELAAQIAESFSVYGKHTRVKHAIIYGGVSQVPQTRALKSGVDVIVATPGRLMDLMGQGYVDLRSIQTFVLDEADRMLDMGFIPDIRKIVAQLPQQRQTLFFSATMPGDVRQLANTLLKDPVAVKIAAKSAAADTVDQIVYLVDQKNKPTLLKHVLDKLPISRALVFTRTKHGADRVALQLERLGIRAEAIHGDKSQSARRRALESFKSPRPPVLVATDVAARGLDIDEVSHVINYDMPNVAETYVHRIGRTGRAGAVGAAISFCSHDERSDLRAIEKLIRQTITVEKEHPEYKPQPHTGKPQNHSARPQTHSKTRQKERTPASAAVTYGGGGGGRPSRPHGRPRFGGGKPRRRTQRSL